MAETNIKGGHVVGVDLGGTKILAGVFTPTLQILGTAKLSTKANRGCEEVVARIVRCVRDAVDEADLQLKQIQAIGIGAPGAVNGETGEVIFAPNLDWHDIPLKKQLEKNLGVPVCVENDCNMAMLGVYAAELKSKPRHAFGIFVGTGIGGGIIINGDLYSGFNHVAGEIGHMVLDVSGPKCGCGNRGCFEALASRTGIFQQLRLAVKAGRKTCLTEGRGDSLEGLRSGDLRKALRRNDKLVEEVVDGAAQWIGIAVANLVNTLSPEVVVLGGGVIAALADDMLAEIIEVARDNAMAGVMDKVEIIASKLGDDAGIIGGAVLARRMMP